ncbi:MAG TPA: hypothetical protein VF173_14085 [Thermoanaerobaculia bacterium]|nr:hypothetical protein [Thermoanaerobaculia bacterium]
MRLFLWGALFSVCAGMVWAGETARDRGSLYATAYTQECAGWPGLEVELTGPGTVRTGRTEQHGFVHFLNLVPGIYALDWKLPNASVIHSGKIHVMAGRNTVMTVTLATDAGDLLAIALKDPCYEEPDTVDPALIPTKPSSLGSWLPFDRPRPAVGRRRPGANPSTQPALTRIRDRCTMSEE